MKPLEELVKKCVEKDGLFQKEKCNIKYCSLGNPNSDFQCEYRSRSIVSYELKVGQFNICLYKRNRCDLGK
jgi:hypothetical protein